MSFLTGDGRLNPKIKKFGALGLIGLTFISIIIIGSTGRVDTTEVGFKRNWVSGKVDFENTYSTGFYWVGFFNNFIVYDTSVQTIIFSKSDGNDLATRTNDGLAIHLDI